MKIRRIAWGLVWAAVAACTRTPQSDLARNINIRLAFEPAKVSADVGTTRLLIQVDNFSATPVRLEDIRVHTSAGDDKVGGVLAQGENRFVATLHGLTDTQLSPVTVRVVVAGVAQSGTVEIVPGVANALTIEPSTDMVNTDDGFVDLVIKVLDKQQNLTPDDITLTTTVGIVSQLVRQADGTYHARLSGLTRVADSPVRISAQAGVARAETTLLLLAGKLDNFTIAPIGTQVAAQPFGIDVTARDKNGNVVTAFEQLVNVRTSRNSNDISPTFTGRFVLGRFVSGETTQFRINAQHPGLSLIVDDGQGHRGESNVFRVEPTPANQILLQSATGFNLVVSADGCVRPSVAHDDCRRGAVSRIDGSGNTIWVSSPLSTRIEMLLRRYSRWATETNAALIGDEGERFVLSLRDATGQEYTEAYSGNPDNPCSGPCIGNFVDQRNGHYFVDVYNLRDVSKSPFTLTARYLSVINDIEISVVPGEAHHIGFPPVPSQRLSDAQNPFGYFFITLTAMDQWSNRVYALQDTVAVHAVRMDSGGQVTQRVRVGDSSTMILGQTFPFLISMPAEIGTGSGIRLEAFHPALGRSYSNAITAFDSMHTTSDFVVLLPGQYDNPPPVPIFGQANLTPPLGEVASGRTPSEQEVNRSFEILILARTRGVQVPVVNFTGSVLLGTTGNADSIEVVDDDCDHSSNGGGATNVPARLTPAFKSLWVGTYAGGYESACYVWVRMTEAADTIAITANEGRSSSIPINPGGNNSSDVRVRQAIAKRLKIATIDSPQLATPDAQASQKFTTTVIVQALDENGKPTNNITGCQPTLTDAPRNWVRYTPKAFVNGVATFDDVWFNVAPPPEGALRDQLVVNCNGVSNGGSIADGISNTFDIILGGPTDFLVFAPVNEVRAHEPFEFTAVACNDASCSTPRTSFYYQVTMTDSTGTLVPQRSEAFQQGVLQQGRGIQTFIDKAQNGVRICLSGAGAFGCSTPFDVKIGQLSYFRFDMTGFPNVITVGEARTINVTPVDAGGNDMPSFLGTVYLNNNYNTASFKLTDGTLAPAVQVMTCLDGTVPRLYYRKDSCAAAGKTKLQVVLREMNSGDHLMIHDGRGHSGFSLPHTFRVVYGPVATVDFEAPPCVPAPGLQTVRRASYWTFCAVAKDVYGNIKKDFGLSGSPVAVTLEASAVGRLHPPTVPFVGGIAQTQVYFDDVTMTNPVKYRIQIGGTYYPDTLGKPINAYAAVTYSIVVTTPPPLLKVNKAFYLDLAVTTAVNDPLCVDGAMRDQCFQGSLRVTDTTGSMIPICGSGEVANCGYVENGVAITGNLYDPFYGGGFRRQWFMIPTELAEDVICVESGFGHRQCVGPINVEGNLIGFDVRPVPATLAVGTDYPLVITAYTLTPEKQVLTTFNAPVQLSNLFGTVNPTVLPPNFVNGVLSTTFRIQAANSGNDRLTVMYNGKTGQSNSFAAQDRRLAAITWDNVATPIPGYVDRTVTLRTFDQFGSVYFYAGRAVLSADTNGYAIRPTQTTNFSSGVWTGKIAVDGPPSNGAIRIKALAIEGSTQVEGLSNPVTISASTITAFNVVLTETGGDGKYARNCPYPIVIEARDTSNQRVTDFSGTVALRWTNLATDGLSPTISPSFVNGIASFNLTMSSQPALLPPFITGYGIQAYIPGTGITGQTPIFDLDETGPCP